jgi:hypothetical protein
LLLLWPVVKLTFYAKREYTHLNKNLSFGQSLRIREGAKGPFINDLTD